MKLSAGIHQYWQRLLLQPQQHGPDSAHFASNGLLELRWFWHTRARHATSTAQFAEPTALPCLLTKCLSDQVRALLFRQYKDTSAVHATPRRLVGRPTRHTALFWAFAAGMTGHTRLITVCPWQESLHNHEYSCALAFCDAWHLLLQAGVPAQPELLLLLSWRSPSQVGICKETLIVLCRQI